MYSPYTLTTFGIKSPSESRSTCVHVVWMLLSPEILTVASQLAVIYSKHTVDEWTAGNFTLSLFCFVTVNTWKLLLHFFLEQSSKM